MATTDLYVLYQSDKKPPMQRKKIEHWFEPIGSARQARVDDRDEQLVKLENVIVIIGEGDVYVKRFDGETVRRSYADITTCHLCKLDRSRSLPTSTHSSRKKKSSDSCILCKRRTETYHRLAEIRVRNALRLGYQRMYGPFNIAGTAPMPFRKFEDAGMNELGELLADCQADLSAGQGEAKKIRKWIISARLRLSTYQRMSLTKRYGAEIFKPHVPGPTATVLEVRPSISHLRQSQEELRALAIELKVIARVWRRVKSILEEPGRGGGSSSRFHRRR